MGDLLDRLTDADWWLDRVADARFAVEDWFAAIGADRWLDEACGHVDCGNPFVTIGALLIALFVLRFLLGRFYIPVLRVGDVVSLVWGNLSTLGGLIRFVSPDEVLNRRNPATFMRLAERKRLLNQFNGGFLMDGKVQRLSRRMSYQSIVSVGGMGTGKTVNLITPNILTADDCSLVITDTSGELYEATSGYLASRGYEIKVLNLIDPARSHRYNPLARVRTYADAEGLAHLLAKGAGSGHTQEPIWDDGAQRLLRIIILALKHGPDADIATLEDVHYWVNSFDGHQKDSRFDQLVVDGSVDDPSILHDYRGFVLGTQEKMLLSFVSTAATALSLLGNPDIARVLSADEFDFRAMKQRKTALYIKVREQSMGTYGPILTLFYSELFDALREDMKGRYPVFLFLDEFGQIKAPGFPSFATTARKFRVGFWVILQSLSQLVDKYGQQAATTIMNGIGTETYFGGMDLSTARDLSGRLGRTFRLDWWKLQPGPPRARPDAARGDHPAAGQ